MFGKILRIWAQTLDALVYLGSIAEWQLLSSEICDRAERVGRSVFFWGDWGWGGVGSAIVFLVGMEGLARAFWLGVEF